MSDLENMVKDELKTEWGLGYGILSAVESRVSRAIDSWMTRHNINDWIEDAVENAISDSKIEEAIEYAITLYVEEMLG